MMKLTILLAALVLACLLLPGSGDSRARGREPGSSWKMGGELQRELERPLSVVWSNVPFRHGLKRLAGERGVAMLIDRRIDPDQLLAMNRQNRPLREVLTELAEKTGCEISWYGPVVYFGPVKRAAELRTLAALRNEELVKLPPNVRKKFLKTRVWKWDELATPRDLLEKLAREADVKIIGLERLPHDLWAEGDLPPLSMADQMTLLLMQYGLTFQIASEGKEIELIPLPTKIALERSYPAEGLTEAQVEAWKEKFPDATITVEGNRLMVKGLMEIHEAIQPEKKSGKILSSLVDDSTGKSAKTTKESKGSTKGKVAGKSGSSEKGKAKGTEEKRYTLRVVQKTPRQVMQELEKGLAVKFQFDPERLIGAGISLETPVSFEVKEATLDELLSAVFRDTGLTVKRMGKEIELLPGENTEKK